MTATPRPMRSRRVSRCPVCALPQALCLCAEMPRLHARTAVVVVAHRDEPLKPSNTGRLLVHLLDGCELRVRGTDRAEALPPLPPGRKLLLYPSPEARELCADDAGAPLVLLVPDGSWTQARRAARRDRWLRTGEPVALPTGAPSRYRLRRSPRDGGLCTLEAVARALGILEGSHVEQALLRFLDRFVERTLAVRSGRAGHAWQRAEDLLTEGGQLRPPPRGGSAR